MIDKLKNNTKMKFISLLSALVLWLYVMTVEDPIENRTFSDIPIAITNVNTIEDKGLSIYPEEELVTDISISANLSSLRLINKDNIYIYGRIEGPKEGKNTIYLQANLPERVNKYDIKPHSITINLEKIINEEKDIHIEIKGTSKINIDEIQPSKKTISVEGPRSIVNKVSSIKATLDVSNKDQDFSTKLKLTPVDSEGNEVKGVTLEEDYIIANVKLLKQKTVPIKLNLIENVEGEDVRTDYILDPEKVTIEGKKEIIDEITSIETQPINLKDIKESDIIEIPLNIPVGIKIYEEIKSIKLKVDKNITTDIIVPKSSIELRNKEEGLEINLDNIPENIKLTIKHSENITSIKEEDISLYVDLSDISLGENKFTIKYETKLDLKSIKINPETIEI